MPEPNSMPTRDVVETVREIDRALPTLPPGQQNLVAAFALGVLTGLSLRRETTSSPEPAKRDGSRKAGGLPSDDAAVRTALD